MKLSSVNPQLQNSLQNLSLDDKQSLTNSQLRTGEAHQGGRPLARRNSEATHQPLQQAIKHQMADIEKQLGRIYTTDDINQVPATFCRDALQHMFAQRRYERAATADHIGDNSWLQMRKSQLHQTPGGGSLAAAQYGMSFAHDKHNGEPDYVRLEIHNPASSEYQRIKLMRMIDESCHTLYKQRNLKSQHRDKLFVNSAFMANILISRLQMKYPEVELQVQPVASGIHAIPCDMLDFRDLSVLAKKYGARPTAQQVMRQSAEAQSGPVQAVSDPRVSNRMTTDILSSTQPQSVLAELRSVPDTLGTYQLAQCDADMVESLMQLLRSEPLAQAVEHNPLVAQGLQGMRFIASTMPALATDSTRFGNAHTALMEEMQIVLNAARPYQPADFHRFAASRMREAIPAALQDKILPPQASMTSSGMQSLCMAADIAQSIGKGGMEPLTNGSKSTPFYYEAEEHMHSLSESNAGRPGDAVVYSTLANSVVAHSSQPQHGWSIDDVAEGVQQRIAQRKHPDEPLNMVLDITLEKPGDMKALLAKLGPALASNQLRIFACKSHQKFAQLGAAKAQGGSLTLLGAKTNSNQQAVSDLQQMEQDQGWFDSDDAQLLTHLTRTAIVHEPALLKQATDNARFVAEHCFHGQDGHGAFAGHEDNMPFAMVVADDPCSDQSSWPGLIVNSESGVKVRLPRTEVMNRDLTRERSSFGFTGSTFSQIGELPGYPLNVSRISFGQETKAELIERFWMASREMQPERQPHSCQQLLDLCTQLVDTALTPQQRSALQDAPLSEKIRQVGRNEAQPLDDAQRNSASLTTLRGNAASPQQFTVNKVASVVSFASQVVEKMTLAEQLAEAADREPLEALLGSFIASGMPGVSRTAREQAVRLQASLCHEDMRSSDDRDRRRGAENLVGLLEKSNVSPGMGLYNHAIPDLCWHEQSAAMKERLYMAVFGRLDVNSQYDYLEKYGDEDDGLLFTLECSMRMSGKLWQTSPEQTAAHWRASVAEEMLGRDITNS